METHELTGTARDTDTLSVTRRLEIIYDAARWLLSTEDPLRLIDALYDRIADALGLEIYLHFQLVGERLRLITHRGLDEATVARVRQMQMDQAICGTVAAAARPMFRENVHESDEKMTDHLREVAITAYACYPLVVRGRTLGTLSFGTRQRGRFREEELALLNSLAEHVAVALDRHQAHEQLKEFNSRLQAIVDERTAVARARAEQVKQLAVRITQAEQQERQRIASVLHDHLQQLLVAAKMRAEMIEEGGKPIEGVISLITEAIDEARSLSVQLHPTVLYKEGIGAALNWLAERMREQHHLAIAVSVDEAACECDQPVSELLYHAARELLLNVVKHAEADNARLVLQRSGSVVVLSVSDDGKGCDPAKVLASAEKSLGLAGLRQRVELLSGQLEMCGAEGENCCVTVKLPQRVDQPQDPDRPKQ